MSHDDDFAKEPQSRAEISYQARERLRSARVPAQFVEMIRTIEGPPVDQGLTGEMEGRPSVTEAEMGEFAWDPERVERWRPDEHETRMEGSGILPTFLDLRLDLTGVPHPTPGLLAMESRPLGGIVTNTYPGLDGGGEILLQQDDSSPGEKENGKAKPPTEPPCLSCRLILIYGTSLVPKAGGGAKVSNQPIQAAHEAAASFYDSWKKAGKGCLHVVHVHWKSGFGATEDGYAFLYRGKAKGWQKTNQLEKVKEWLDVDEQGRDLARYSEVLAVYHGETRQKSIDVLKWLGTFCRVPICKLYLWSCWGADKIDPVNREIKGALAKVVGVRARFEARLKKEIKKLERRIRQSPKAKDVKQRRARLARLRSNLECECSLCIFTAPFLPMALSAKKLAAEITRLKAINPRTAQQRKRLRDAKKAQGKLTRAIGAGKRLAVPLSINKDTDSMVLHSLANALLRYCWKKNQWTRAQRVEVNEILPGMPVRNDPDPVGRIIKSILKQPR